MIGRGHTHGRRAASPQFCAVLAVAMLIAASPRGAKDAADPEPPKRDRSEKSRLHGALPMTEQLARLKALVPGRDLAYPPAGIDPAMWDAVIPADNKLTSARVALGK